MAKHTNCKHTGMPFSSDHPGCMWGIFNFFDFHQRLHSRNVLQDKKRGGGRRAGGIRMSKMTMEVSATFDLHGVTDGVVDNLAVEDKSKETSTRNKNSGKTCMKALIAEEMSKEQDQKPQLPTFPSRLMRLDAFHYPELEEHALLGKPTRDGDSLTLDVRSHDTGVPVSSMLDPLLPKSPQAQTVYIKQCEPCSTINDVNHLRHIQLDDLGRQLLEKHAILQEKLDEARKAFLKKKFMDDEEATQEVEIHQSKEFLDALEIFNTNRELFLKILQDPSSMLANHISSYPEKVLSKSGSFPISRAQVTRHEEKENGLPARHEGELQAGNSTPKSRIAASLKDWLSKSMPFMTDDTENDSFKVPARIVILKPGHGNTETAGIGSDLVPSSGSHHELKGGRGSGSVANRFKDIKQRIKHAIKESRKERQRISMDGILHKIPYGQKTSEYVTRDTGPWKETETDRDGRDSPRLSYWSVNTASSRSWDSLNSFNRCSSLGELPIRHSRWPECDLSREAKRHLSERLKLVCDDEGLQSRKDLKSLGRIMSLPELNTRGFYSPCRDMQSEVSPVVLDSGVAGVLDGEWYNYEEQSLVDTHLRRENSIKSDGFADYASSGNPVETNRSDLIDETREQLVLDTSGHAIAKCDSIDSDLDYFPLGENDKLPLYEQDIGAANDSNIEPVHPKPAALDSYFQEDNAIPANVCVSEGSELETRCVHLDELAPSVSQNNEPDMDIPNTVIRKTDIQTGHMPTESAISDSAHVQVDARDTANFTYVRDVLKASGFSGAEFLGTWHSPDQPVDPSLFDEVEGCPCICSVSGEEASGSCDLELLFDCINEVLLEIYERSFSHCPSFLSFNTHIRPMPVGYHVLEEVWASISWHLSSQLQANASLEHVVARDFAKNDGWMCLQGDAECVGLELEALILDDLLEETLLQIGS